MRGSSLATRLFLSATAWVVVILVITGIILSSVYRSATERAFDRRLNLYLRTLVAEVAAPDTPDHEMQSLGEPLFELPLSGWYWEIAPVDDPKAEKKASRSLWDKKLPKLEDQGVELTSSGIRQGYVDGPEDQRLRMVERP
ncbi:MAG: sensor histidine kinase, partial [Tardiphaga sp.]|nr:sensor histidine kinase [Tardiphaga sp.]